MNRRLILLNVALVALAAIFGWLLRERWIQARAGERAFFDQAARKRIVLPPPPSAPPKPPTAAEYIETAQKTLFSQDRNPNVVIEAPPAKPEPPMPPLPFYYGQMALGKPVVFLATPKEGQKSYHAGDKIGDFEVVSFDRDKIDFKWNDKTVERKLADLKPKEEAPPVAAAPVAAPRATFSQAKALASSPDKPDEKPVLGVDMGAGYRGCVAGDATPAGTVVDGYKKMEVRGLMGMSCRWELAK
ncbi:MAG: hypothetical protein ACRD30_05165 [Bryobacteraceae bacterium]